MWVFVIWYKCIQYKAMGAICPKYDFHSQFRYVGYTMLCYNLNMNIILLYNIINIVHVYYKIQK